MDHKYENIILWWIFPGIAIIPIAFLIANMVSLDFNNDSFTKIITFIWCVISLFGLYFLIQYLVSNLILLFTLMKHHKKDEANGTDIVQSTLAENENGIIKSENTHSCRTPISTGCKNNAQIILSENIESIVKTAVMQSKELKAEVLAEIIKYSVHIMSSHMNRENIEKLCKNIELYAEKEYPDNLESVVTKGTLRSIDFRHFAWNIGKRLNYSGKSKATFIKIVFEQELKESEISSLEQNLKQGGNCIIHIDEPQNGDFRFHLS